MRVPKAGRIHKLAEPADRLEGTAQAVGAERGPVALMLRPHAAERLALGFLLLQPPFPDEK